MDWKFGFIGSNRATLLAVNIKNWILPCFPHSFVEVLFVCGAHQDELTYRPRVNVMITILREFYQFSAKSQSSKKHCY
jgi:hypothetical protein